MGRLFLHCLCLVSLLSSNLANCTITDDEEPRRTYPIRRAIDGTRGRKYYVQEDGNLYDGTSNGQYDPYDDETDMSDIRNNIPGEPGVDYPAYTRLPQTEFVCDAHFKGYYADEDAGCQVFHVCDGNFLVSSFLCPVGLIFSQKLLTCDWWAKVDCSLTRNYHQQSINTPSLTSEVIENDEDEILRKAFEMSMVKSSGERIPSTETITQQSHQRHQQQNNQRNERVFNYDRTVTERTNDLPTGQDIYNDYSDYPTRLKSRYRPTASTRGKKTRQRYENKENYYDNDEATENQSRENDKISISINANGDERENNNRQQNLYNKNEFLPSYSPTVPTIMTTVRKFYSPTVPTTYRPFTTRQTFDDSYDLEFEGSDHLYTARGRSRDNVKPATPPTRVIKHDVKLKNVNNPIFIDRMIDVTEEIDPMEESANFHTKVHSPNENIQNRNFSKINSYNETIVLLNDKEKLINENLDRLTKKITETLAVLTFDNENSDQSRFSYNHDEKTNNNETTNTSDSSIVKNSTIFRKSLNSNEIEKPAVFLQPPKENQSQFRITVLEENSKTRLNEKFPSNVSSLKRDSEGKIQNIRRSGISLIPVATSDENDIRESRIIRIVVNNNATSVNSSEKRTEKPTIFIENFKSIDLSPEGFSVSRNFNETPKSQDEVEETLKITKKIDKSSLNSTILAEEIGASTTVRSDDLTKIVNISKFKDSFDLGRNEETTKFTNSTITLNPIEIISTQSTIANNENSSKIFDNEELSSNVTLIDETNDNISLTRQIAFEVNENMNNEANNDEIRKLMVKQEIDDSIGAANYKNFEIVRSNEPSPLSSRYNTEIRNFNYETTTNLQNNGELRVNNENLPNFQSNVLQSTENYLRSIVALANGSNSPRPFSLETSQNVDFKYPVETSDELISQSFVNFSEKPKNTINPESAQSTTIRTTETIVLSSEETDLEKSLETLESSSTGFHRDSKNNYPVRDTLESGKFGEKERKTRVEKLNFELPDTRRFVDFETGQSVGVSENFDTEIQEERNNERTNETTEELEKNRGETVVQTEFIPSLGFSLNTEEEREKYMEAVVKGLLHDVTATETTNNENNTSIES